MKCLIGNLSSACLFMTVTRRYHAGLDEVNRARLRFGGGFKQRCIGNTVYTINGALSAFEKCHERCFT